MKRNGAAARDEAVQHGGPGVAEIAFRPQARVHEVGLVGRRREPLFEEGSRQDRHSSQHAAMVVDGSDLTRLPADDHDFPVVEKEDGVADVVGRVEAYVVQIAFRLA